MAEGTRDIYVLAGGALIPIYIRDGKKAGVLTAFELMEQQEDIVLKKIEMLNGRKIASIVDDSMDGIPFTTFEALLEYLNTDFKALHPKLVGRWNFSSDSTATPGDLPTYSRTKQTFNYTNEDGFEQVTLHFDDGVFNSVFNDVFN